MKLKFNTSITMSTGNTGTSVVAETFNERFALGNGKFICDIKVWKSQSDKDSGKDHTYLFAGGNKITKAEYAIPQSVIDDAIANNPGDMDAATDEAFTSLGSNHRSNLFDAIASLLSINASDIETIYPV